MNQQTYINRIKTHSREFDRLWQKVVDDTNSFIKDNPDTNTYSLLRVEKFSDYLCLSGAWIIDRLDGKSGIPHNSKYKGSLTKKIRKALGYTL